MRTTQTSETPIPANATPLQLRALRLQTAIDLHLDGQLEQSEAIYTELLKDNPADADALCLCGVLAQQRGQSERALELMQTAVSLAPDNPNLNHTLANTLRELKRYSQAVLVYDRVVGLDPKNLTAWFNYGSTLQHLRKYAHAILCYQEILSRDKQFVQAHNDMAAALIALKQFDAAALSAKAAIEIKPDYAEAYNNLGVVAKNQKRYDEAIHYYRQALHCKPDYAMAFFNLGTVYFTREEWEPALEMYRRSLALDPTQLESHQNMASILQKQGKRAQAQTHLDAAYSSNCLIVDGPDEPRTTVLLLWSSGNGNIPVEHLWPPSYYGRVFCVMEYFTAADIERLPKYDIVFNAIGDSDSVEATQASVSIFLATNTKPLLNSPTLIGRTARDQIGSLFSAIDNVVCATTLRSETAGFKQAVQRSTGLKFPIIIRPSGSHGGDHLEKLETPEDLQNVTCFDAEAYYASNYIDYRSSDGFYRKYRIIFINRQAFPYHLAISPNWIVHYLSADMPDIRWKLDEELVFLETPRRAIGDKAMDAIERIGQAMNLDYCGVDFSVLPDGRVLVFEANATMLVHAEDANGPLKHKNPYVKNIFNAFNMLVVGLTSK